MLNQRSQNDVRITFISRFNLFSTKFQRRNDVVCPQGIESKNMQSPELSDCNRCMFRIYSTLKEFYYYISSRAFAC